MNEQYDKYGSRKILDFKIKFNANNTLNRTLRFTATIPVLISDLHYGQAVMIGKHIYRVISVNPIKPSMVVRKLSRTGKQGQNEEFQGEVLTILKTEESWFYEET